MTAESGDIETVSDYIAEAKRMGFVILPPDINESFSDFTVVVENGTITNKIRFGLNSIKNFGTEIGKAIIHERKQNGHYTGITDFLQRVLHKNLNKKSLEALIMTGAFDTLGERGVMIGNIDEMLKFNSELRRENESSQTSLFAGFGDVLPTGTLTMDMTIPPASQKQKLLWEKELLGLYVSGHPLDEFREQLSAAKQSIKDLLTSERLPGTTAIAGIVLEVREIFTKKHNDKMAFVKIADLTGTMEAVVFPKTFDDVRRLLVVDKLVMASGKITDREGVRSMMIDTMKELK